MKTPRLELTRLTEDHLPGYHKIWKDPYTTRWSPHGPCKTQEESKEWMSGLLPDTNPKGENYAITLRTPVPPPDSEFIPPARKSDDDTILTPGAFLGWIGTWRSEPVPEVGFIFDRGAWGFGFATEALRGFLEGFWDLREEFDVLDAWCDTENQASKNVLMKCGFELVEVVYGDYTLEWMEPKLRNSFHFRIKRPCKE
ncbi:hypothetical protein PENSTE_c012G00252 [Penicillium steckii]|uniref:N-acetyltransferase domain-containing protein n=1 Tax=Penicillium steckii TaxID=303698 RepID=A0A1V6T4J3_9EURO|nr:hypothetical protein PENSTE_c012G00252 [Penicillium steckii]